MQTNNEKVTVKIDKKFFSDVEIEIIENKSTDIAGMITKCELKFNLNPPKNDFKNMNELLNFAQSINKPILYLLMPNEELLLKVNSFIKQEDNSFYVIAEN